MNLWLLLSLGAPLYTVFPQSSHVLDCLFTITKSGLVEKSGFVGKSGFVEKSRLVKKSGFVVLSLIVNWFTN